MHRPHASCVGISVAWLASASSPSTSLSQSHLGVHLPWLVPIVAALVATVTLTPSSLRIIMFTVSSLLSHLTNSLEHLLSCLASPHPVSLQPRTCLACVSAAMACLASLKVLTASEQMPWLHHCVQQYMYIETGYAKRWRDSTGTVGQ